MGGLEPNELELAIMLLEAGEELANHGGDRRSLTRQRRRGGCRDAILDTTLQPDGNMTRS